MKIIDAISFIEDLMNNAEKKSEKNLYKTFYNVLSSLESKDLNKEQITLIENKLEELDITSIEEKRVKYLKRKFVEFTQFLEKEFSLIQQGHYVSLGMVFGMVFGLVLATSIGFEFGMGDETTGGIVGGMLIGVIVGSVMDLRAEKQNRVLKSK